MAVMHLFLQSNFQVGQNWRFDPLSFGVGLLAGLILAVGLYKVWPSMSRWRDSGLGRLQKTLGWVRASVEARYLNETAVMTQTHHLGRQWAKLEQIFVPPRLSAPITEIDPNNLPHWGAEHLNTLWPELALRMATPLPAMLTAVQLLASAQRVLIAGHSGGGKTTLLAYYAHHLATTPLISSEKGLPAVPAWVHFAEMDFTPLSDKEKNAGIAWPLIVALQKRSGPLTSAGMKEFIQTKLKNGQLFLLLDGWGELTVTAQAQAHQWLQNLLRQYPQTRVIMAVPLAGYYSLLDLHFTLTTLQPWRAGLLEQFITQWATILKPTAPYKVADFWHPNQSAVENSLQLWRMLLQNDKSALPAASNLFQSALSLLSGELKNKEDKNTPPLYPLVTVFWQKMAYQLTIQEKLFLTQAEVAVLAAEFSQENALEDKKLVSRLQKSVVDSPLFIARSDGQVRFLSQTWRYFFTAGYLASQNLAEVVMAQIHNPQWSDILKFYASQASITHCATSLLSRNDHPLSRESLFQAASWMRESQEVGDWRRQTLIQLGQIVRQPHTPHLLRQRAVCAMAQTGEEGVFTFILQLLERSDPLLRQIGVASLSLFTHKEEKMVAVLEKMLTDPEPLVRQTAVHTLTWLPTALSERLLITTLLGSDDEMARVAALGLALNGSEGIQILKEAVADEAANVRRAAVLGVSILDEEWVVPLLEKVQRNDNEWMVRSAANVQLQGIQERQQPAPWHPFQLNQQEWLVDYAADNGQEFPDDSEATAYLVAQFKNPACAMTIRTAVALILGQLTAREALPALEPACLNEEFPLKEAAFWAYTLIQRAGEPLPDPSAIPPVVEPELPLATPE